MTKLILLQRDIVWASPAENTAAAEQAILAAPQADLYVLPEMFSTGFATDPYDIAETDQHSLQWMQQLSQRIDAAIAGSVAVKAEDGSYRNRFYFVKPDGTYAFYDKRHLFTYGGENLRYTAGNERVVVEWRGVRYLLQVCYDLRFPVFARNHGDYDCILYVASWPSSRIRVWDALLPARAIENQCYVCGVNRVGKDPVCEYSGATTAIDAYGRTLAKCPDNEVTAIAVDLDMEALTRFRAKFPVLNDRDPSSSP